MKNNKSLGQHWLKDRQILDDIAELAQAEHITTCLEIGPGLGTLTSALLRRFSHVIAVEYDATLAAHLPQSFPGKNLTVIHQDFLKYDLSQLTEPFCVAGNIPYYITSPIIHKLLESSARPSKIVLLIQKEVAERILDQRKHSVLSLEVENLAQVLPGFVVPKEYFTPPPKVDSATIVLIPRPSPLVSPAAITLAKQGFSNPRKKLLKHLPYSHTVLMPLFAKLGIHPDARPADLSLQDWDALVQALAK